jgi:O-antigen ligase
MIMPRKQISSREMIHLGRDIIIIGVAVTLAITPSLTIDAFNPPKFAILVTGVSYLLLRYWRLVSNFINDRLILIWILTSLVTYISVLLINRYSFSERLFGIEGRNFGFIALIALNLIRVFSYCASKDDELFIFRFVNGLAWANSAVCFIFFLQDTGIAFIDFTNVYSVLPSTLGNPNFLSAFLGISAITLLVQLLDSSIKMPLRMIHGSFFLYSIFIVIKSNSIQGLIALIITITSLFYFVIIRKMNTSSKIYFVFFALLGSVIVGLGFMGLGPFGESLAQNTLRNRLVYWKIAMRIAKDSPFFGKGFDSYSDYYREFVENSDYEDLGGTVVSNSPHNIFFDFLTSGGIFMCLSFLAIVAYALYCALKTSKVSLRKNGFEIRSVVPFAIFLSLLSISLISPFQIGLFIWLYVVIGFLIGVKKENNQLGKVPMVIRTKLLQRTSSLLLVCFMLICNLATALLPVITENRFRNAVEEQNFTKLNHVALAWPVSGNRAVLIARAFVKSSFELKGGVPGSDSARQIEFLKDAAEDLAFKSTMINNRQYDSWVFLYEYSTKSSLKAIAKAKLSELDPTNREWQR